MVDPEKPVIFWLSIAPPCCEDFSLEVPDDSGESG